MEINKERIKSNMLKIGEIGREKGAGITRLAFSDEYNKASQELKKLFKETGIEISTDGIGDIYGRRKGKKDLPAIMFGSHLDTVRNGGLFDGLLGIIAGLECINVLNENNITTTHPLELVAFNAEEGSEMGGTFASRVMTGLQDPEEKNLKNKINKYGLTVEDIKNSVRDISNIKAFLELHIEQGKILDSEGYSIGIVNGIAGITRYDIIVEGEVNHAGTTPMNLRKDAMTIAARLIGEINRLALSIGDPFVATVGRITAYPGSVNVIPGRVEFTLEIRDLKQSNIESFMTEIISFAESIKGFDFKFSKQINKPSVKTNKEITDFIEEVCQKSEYNYRILASGAGHDAKEIARKIPTGMIFVPSKDGKSHCPEEWTDWDYIYKGTEVLLKTILSIDKNL